MQFPMTVTHRTNPHAQVVVANLDQYEALPDDFKPQLTSSGQVGAPIAASAIPGVNLDVETTAAGNISATTTEDAERRQSLDEAVDEFTKHVQAEETRLAGMRDQIEQDRAALREQQEALARERADFEAQKNMVQMPAADAAASPADAGTPAVADPDAATPPAAPAKRTRGAKAEG